MYIIWVSCSVRYLISKLSLPAVRYTEGRKVFRNFKKKKKRQNDTQGSTYSKLQRNVAVGKPVAVEKDSKCQTVFLHTEAAASA